MLPRELERGPRVPSVGCTRIASSTQPSRRPTPPAPARWHSVARRARRAFPPPSRRRRVGGGGGGGGSGRCGGEVLRLLSDKIVDRLGVAELAVAREEEGGALVDYDAVARRWSAARYAAVVHLLHAEEALEDGGRRQVADRLGIFVDGVAVVAARWRWSAYRRWISATSASDTPYAWASATVGYRFFRKRHSSLVHASSRSDAPPRRPR